MPHIRFLFVRLAVCYRLPSSIRCLLDSAELLVLPATGRTVDFHHTITRALPGAQIKTAADSSFKYCRRPFISTDCVKQAPQSTIGLLAAGRCIHRTARTGTAVGIKTALMVRATIHHACTMMEFHAFEHILLFG